MRTFQIFGRKTYVDPLHFIDRIQLDNETNLREKVLEKVGADDWVELISIPEDKIKYVVAKGKTT